MLKKLPIFKKTMAWIDSFCVRHSSVQHFIGLLHQIHTSHQYVLYSHDVVLYSDHFCLRITFAVRSFLHSDHFCIRITFAFGSSLWALFIYCILRRLYVLFICALLPFPLFPPLLSVLPDSSPLTPSLSLFP